MLRIKKLQVFYLYAMLLLPTRLVHANALVLDPSVSNVSVGDPFS